MLRGFSPASNSKGGSKTVPDTLDGPVLLCIGESDELQPLKIIPSPKIKINETVQKHLTRNELLLIYQAFKKETILVIMIILN